MIKITIRKIYYIITDYITLYHVILYYMRLYHIILYCIVFYCILFYYLILYYVVYIILHYIISHDMVLYHIILYYSILYYIIFSTAADARHLNWVLWPWHARATGNCVFTFSPNDAVHLSECRCSQNLASEKRPAAALNLPACRDRCVWAHVSRHISRKTKIAASMRKHASASN